MLRQTKIKAAAPVLSISNEVSGTVSVMALDADTTPPEILNIENGKTYYVTKKVVAYNDDETPITVKLNGVPVAESFFLPGNREATYTVSAKDSVGNETVYTVYMKPISSITDKLGGITEDTVTSDNRAVITEAETQLLDIAGAYDENESTPEEWNELKAALDRCQKLEAKIAEVSAVLGALCTAADGYSADTVSESDKESLEKLAADLKTLVSSGNLTQSEKTQAEAQLLKVNALLEKIGQSGGTQNQPEPSKPSGQDSDKPNSSEKETEKPTGQTEQPKISEKQTEKPKGNAATSPKTGDNTNLSLFAALLFVSGGTLAGVTAQKKKKSKN